MDYHSGIIVADDVDTIFLWKSTKSDTFNKYRIRIYWVTWEKAIVVVTEPSDNQDKKVDNAIEKIASFCDRTCDLVRQKIMWIEHYPVGNSSDKDTYPSLIILGEVK